MLRGLTTLKNYGIHSIDLGGFSKLDMPGIYHWKQRLNGSLYSLMNQFTS